MEPGKYGEQALSINIEGAVLQGDLAVPTSAAGLVLFLHGSGSSRHSPRNLLVGSWLRDAGLATLHFDLLTPAEELEDLRTYQLRFDIDLLSRRSVAVVDWLSEYSDTAQYPIGAFGSSTGAAAAINAAAERPQRVRAVVSRGGRVDLAHYALHDVEAATLLVVGELDQQVLEWNRASAAAMTRARALDLQIVPGAGHLFEQPGALEQVGQLAADWFRRYLPQEQQPGRA